MEKDLIKERTIRGKLAKARKGYYVGGNMPPTGYTLDSNKKMIEDKDEKKIVIEIFELCADGESIEKISKIISAKGYKTKFEKLKKDTNKRIKKVENHWAPRTIGRMLRNECYIGHYYYGKYTKKYEKGSKIGKQVENPKEDWIKIPCPAIIDEDIFNKAQKVIDRNKKKGKGGLKLFTGKINCGLCGRAYTSYPTTKGTTSYRCGNTMPSKAINKNYLCHNNEVSDLNLRTNCIDRIKKLIKNPRAYYDDYMNNKKDFQKSLTVFQDQIKEIDSNVKKIDNEIKIINKEINNESTTERNKKRLREDIIDKDNRIDFQLNRKNEIEIKLKDLLKQKNSLKVIEEFINTYNFKLSTLTKIKENDLINLFVENVNIIQNEVLVELNIKGNSDNKELYDRLKDNMVELDQDSNKKKLQKVVGGIKSNKNCYKDIHDQ